MFKAHSTQSGPSLILQCFLVFKGMACSFCVLGHLNVAMALHSVSQHEHKLFGLIDVPSLAGCNDRLAHSLTTRVIQRRRRWGGCISYLYKLLLH